VLVKLFISEIVHTEDSFLLKLYYKFNFATEPFQPTYVSIKVSNASQQTIIFGNFNIAQYIFTLSLTLISS
ncbi:TPA: hypothetical protein ACN1Z6_001250, partial [Staphylococcus aureus]